MRRSQITLTPAPAANPSKARPAGARTCEQRLSRRPVVSLSVRLLLSRRPDSPLDAIGGSKAAVAGAAADDSHSALVARPPVRAHARSRGVQAARSRMAHSEWGMQAHAQAAKKRSDGWMDQDGEAGGAYRMRERGAHYRGQLPAPHAHAGWMDARSSALALRGCGGPSG